MDIIYSIIINSNNWNVCNGEYFCENKDIITILNEQLTPQADLEQEVHTACGSDMMSDVLAYIKDQSALITGHSKS